MLDAGPHVAVVMTAHDGQRYFCELPPIPAADADAAGDAADAAGDVPRSADARRRRLWRSRCPPSPVPASTASRAGGPTSSATASTCVEYHQDNAAAKPRANSPLGVFDAAATAAAARDHPAGAGEGGWHTCSPGARRAISPTSRERRRFNSRARWGKRVNAIASIQEPSTCRYAFTFATPLVCGRGGFREAKKPPAARQVQAGGEDKRHRRSAEGRDERRETTARRAERARTRTLILGRDATRRIARSSASPSESVIGGCLVALSTRSVSSSA